MNKKMNAKRCPNCIRPVCQRILTLRGCRKKPLEDIKGNYFLILSFFRINMLKTASLHSLNTLADVVECGRFKMNKNKTQRRDRFCR